MLVVSEELDLGHSARVLLKVRDELARSDLPDANLALHAARADKFAAAREADRGDSALVSVVDLPEQLAVVNTVSSDLSVRPATQDDFICEDGTHRVHATLARCCLGRLGDTASCNRVGVRVPESDSAVLAASDELVRDSWHEPDVKDRLCVVLTQEHLREVLISESVQISLVCSHE